MATAPHIWLRAEARASEARTPLMPEGAAALLARGFAVTVEQSPTRIIPDADFAAAGCAMAPEGSWPDAPPDAVILGLKELPPAAAPLSHAHIFFAHAFKGQPDAPALLERFRRGGGTLWDLEYLVDERGVRVAAFGYYAGYVGAAVSLLAWCAAQRDTGAMPAVSAWPDADAMIDAVRAEIGRQRPTALVIGAKGRVGQGAADFLGRDVGLALTLWDKEETAGGGPFPEVAEHDLMVNAVLAMPGIPVFAGPDILTADRRLTVIGDVACDPGTPYNPIPLYDAATSWAQPVVRVHDAPPLDIMAIDNLPSLLPREASQEFAAALLPHLLTLGDRDEGVWARAEATFRHLLQ
ncbi:saccharopine dehydrogenase [Roseisalinus antarcticus]|uniref:Saccharopine dehydrogenase [NAD(+), L-lysine-forming] n=1 Tax=Roseisalinus antarcticus TaxID=254357 RepID=A0A1Y5SLR9_9RHOB|nr:saccharopine dehydrogenase [Roseisalinus antarcticus]SLN43692.1 hypothetical protein ROA7023_01791 [Roseisalinus antarcticus]